MMHVRIEECALVMPPHDAPRETFEAVRERVAPVGPRAYHGHEALRHAVVECRTYEKVDGEICARCIHLLNAVPARDGRSVRLRCVLIEEDRVTALMTLSRDLVLVDENESVAVAAARLLDHGVEQLVMTRQGVAVGLVLASDLAGREAEALADLARPLPVVPRTLSLAELAASLRARDLDCVAVVDGDLLLGLVTRGDLRRAGVPSI